MMGADVVNFLATQEGEFAVVIFQEGEDAFFLPRLLSLRASLTAWPHKQTSMACTITLALRRAFSRVQEVCSPPPSSPFFVAFPPFPLTDCRLPPFVQAPATFS
jgi:hypothetical protein